MRDQAYVIGAGLITAIGNSVSEAFASLQKGASGIGPITLFETVHQLKAGEVKFTNEELANKLGVSSTLPRSTLLAIHAARAAVKDAGIPNLNKWRTGLISATTVGGIDKSESFFTSFMNDNADGDLHDIVHHPSGDMTDIVANDLGITGFTSTINTACSSSVNAIMLASRLIRSGQLDIVVAGGADALTRFTLNGFNSLMILDKNQCRPFDANRNGLNLGEGAAFVVVASAEVIGKEKKAALCQVTGFGNANDAYHQTASSPEGRGSFVAMDQALKMSGITPADIDYINVHGTATINNDLSEGTAIKRLFGDPPPPFSSTKGFTGHTLGASGAIESVFSALAIKEQCVFGSAAFETPMPELNLIPQKTFQGSVKVKHVMSNSFGFGGNCSSIIFSTAD